MSKSNSSDLLIMFLIFPVGIFLNGYVISVLWLWFIVPLGVTSIGIAHGFGVALIIKFISIDYKTIKDHNEIETVEKMLAVVFVPLFVLLVGYIVQLFM